MAPGPAPVVEVLAASPLPMIAWGDLLDTTAPCVPDEVAASAVRLACGTQRVVRISIFSHPGYPPTSSSLLSLVSVKPLARSLGRAPTMSRPAA